MLNLCKIHVLILCKVQWNIEFVYFHVLEIQNKLFTKTIIVVNSCV